MELLKRHPLTGSSVFDLQIVATMLANRVNRIYKDHSGHFEVFPELSCRAVKHTSEKLISLDGRLSGLSLAIQGLSAARRKYLVHRREADEPNATWQADHTPLDILLIRPDGVAAKPWLTTVIDDRSCAVAGYFFSFEAPSALHTSLAMHQAIWRKRTRAGLCSVFLTFSTQTMEATSIHPNWNHTLLPRSATSAS